MSDLFMERDAVISECGKYRYLLRRAWDHKLPRATFVMLNPSTADAEVDDATIRSCIRLCKSWGYGSFEVVNLFAYRSAKPDELAKVPDPCGPKCDVILEGAVQRSEMTICAWGAHPMAIERGRNVWSTIHALRPSAFCLGVTKSGAPKHPLYIKIGTRLEVYRA